MAGGIDEFVYERPDTRDAISEAGGQTHQLPSLNISEAALWLKHKTCVLLGCRTDDASKARWIAKARAGNFLCNVPSDLWADRDFVVAAVAADGHYLEKVDGSLRQDKEVLSAAIVSNANAMRNVPLEIKADRELMCAAMQSAGETQEELWNERDLCLDMVSRNGLWLRFVSKELRGDRQVVLTAVSTAGEALQYASGDLRKDREVCLTALVCDHRKALRHVAPELRRDREVLDLVIECAQKKCGFIWDLQEIPPEMWKDKAFVMAAVACDGHKLRYAAPEFRSERDVVEKAVMRHAGAIKHVDQPLNRDPRILAMAGLVEIGSDVGELHGPILRDVVVSGRFGLIGEASPVSARTQLEMKKHPIFFQRCYVHCPVVDLKFCGPADQAADLNFPCRGDCGLVCTMMKEGLHCTNHPTCGPGPEPTSHSCWRYYTRHFVERAHKTGGFMVQIVEFDHDLGMHVLDKSQLLEAEMATLATLKVFAVELPGPSVVDVAVRTLARRIEKWVREDVENPGADLERVVAYPPWRAAGKASGAPHTLRGSSALMSS